MSCNCNNKNKVKICGQTNIPQVDNSLIECSECGFISTNCIVIPNSLSFPNLSNNITLTDLIISLVSRIEELENN